MEIWTQITKGGRLVLPTEMLKALKLKAGDDVILRLEGDSIRMISLQLAVNLAQEAVRKYVPEGVSLVDELIRARRAET